MKAAVLVLLMIGCAATLEAPPGGKLPKKIVYHRRAEKGNNQITSAAEATAICKALGGRGATRAELDKYITKYKLRYCGTGPCGFLRPSINKAKAQRVFEVPCEDGKKSSKCPIDPSEKSLAGYDAWCFGPPPSEEQEDLEAPLDSPPSTPADPNVEHCSDGTLSLADYVEYKGLDCSTSWSSLVQIIDTLEETDQDLCLKKCTEDDQCTGFSSTASEKKCVLYSGVCVKYTENSISTTYVKPAYSSGTKRLYREHMGVGCEPESPGAKAWTKEWQCRRLCDDIETCYGFTFHDKETDKDWTQGKHYDNPRGFCAMKNSTEPCGTLEPHNMKNFYAKLPCP